MLNDNINEKYVLIFSSLKILVKIYMNKKKAKYEEPSEYDSPFQIVNIYHKESPL